MLRSLYKNTYLTVFLVRGLLLKFLYCSAAFTSSASAKASYSVKR